MAYGDVVTGEHMPVETIISIAKAIVEVGCVATMIGAPIALIFYARYMERPFLGEGVIRFLAISEIIPAIVILGLETVLDKAATGTLLAGVAGYVLGGMGDNRNPPKDSKNSTSAPPPLPETGGGDDDVDDEGDYQSSPPTAGVAARMRSERALEDA